MRKVIFEQTGNMISIVLLIATLIELMNNFKGDIYHFEISSGMLTVALIVWMLFFYLLVSFIVNLTKIIIEKKVNTAYLTKEKK